MPPTGAVPLARVTISMTIVYCALIMMHCVTVVMSVIERSATRFSTPATPVYHVWSVVLPSISDWVLFFSFYTTINIRIFQLLVKHGLYYASSAYFLIYGNSSTLDNSNLFIVVVCVTVAHITKREIILHHFRSQDLKPTQKPTSFSYHTRSLPS